MLTTSPRLEIFSDLTSIDDGSWQRLLDQSPTRTIFQTPEYLRTWWSTFGRGKLMFIAAYEDDRLVAIAPLFADQGMVFFVGSGGSDYLDFIGGELAQATLSAILELARYQTPGFLGFCFYHIPDHSPTGRALAQCAVGLDLECFEEGSHDAPRLRFSDWPADTRPPSEKKSLVRHARALHRKGQLQVDHFAKYSQVEPLLDAFFEQHIARWAPTPFPSLFLDDAQRRFYRQLAQALDACGTLRFTRLSLNEEPLAFHFGFSFHGQFLWYKPSFDIRHADQSPGEVLLRSLILEAQSERAEVFDFGLGDEPFKQRFLTETTVVRNWGLYPSSR